MLSNVQMPQMATINETAKITGLARHFIRQLALQNKIKHIRAGKKILINIEKLIEYLNNGDNEPATPVVNRYNIQRVEV